ncbi:MAG: hemerythrin protein [Herminiimonas sp.]|nr:hemerythrin protein [Herminiimonas sp.]MDB5854448.1 hemerythrin protein [Herminiimonas sp.]
MNSLMTRLSPTITNMIRMDHTHVLASFHQYHIDDSAQTRQALVNTICIALEIHAQLEEEIFYPAMRSLEKDRSTVEKSFPEHAEMKRLIARLRTMEPDDAGYNDTFMELMRDVMHHVADEETILLRDAERNMDPDRLSELGAEMTKLRLQLAAPRAGEIAWNTVRGLPATSMLIAAGAVLAGTYLVRRGGRRHDA